MLLLVGLVRGGDFPLLVDVTGRDFKVTDLFRRVL